MTSCDDRPVIRLPAEQYGEDFLPHLIEQYKLFVSSAENVSLRRVTSNRYLLAISAGLVALYGAQATALSHGYWMLPLPIIGIASACLWMRIIDSHRDLNRIKFELIHEIEHHLPAALFEEEWSRTKHGQSTTYREVTKIERAMPITFVCVHIAILVMIVLANTSVYDWATVTAVISNCNDH